MEAGSWFWVWIGVLSLWSFVLTAWDKSRAQKGASRIRERTLLGLALAGGSPGLFAGMLVFRHKTRKGSFQARFLLVILVQVLLYAAWAWTRRA